MVIPLDKQPFSLLTVDPRLLLRLVIIRLLKRISVVSFSVVSGRRSEDLYQDVSSWLGFSSPFHPSHSGERKVMIDVYLCWPDKVREILRNRSLGQHYC